MAGIGIYFGENDSRNTSKEVEGKQSNNTAELDAIRQTFKIIEKDIISGKKVCIVSDSEYAIKCVTTYGQKCSETNWTKDIPNKELVKEIYNMYKNINNVKFIHIMAHTGNNDIHSIGNDGADKLANQAIGLEHCPYSKLYLDVPFSKKNEIKTFGGRWDSGKKQWFIFHNNKEKTKILSKFKTII
jgi:ribonuclease HI